MGSDRNVEDRNNNCQATQYLFEKVVSSFINDVLLQIFEKYATVFFATGDLHYFGINVRHIGVVSFQLRQKKSSFWSNLDNNPLFGQIFSRTIKNLLRSLPRSVAASGKILFS